MFLGYLLIFTFIFYFYISYRYIPGISWDHINITICMDFTEIIHFVAPTINSSNWPKLTEELNTNSYFLLNNIMIFYRVHFPTWRNCHWVEIA